MPGSIVSVTPRPKSRYRSYNPRDTGPSSPAGPHLSFILEAPP